MKELTQGKNIAQEKVEEPQENHQLINFNKELGSNSDYHMTLKSDYKHNQDPKFKAKPALELKSNIGRNCFSEIGNDELYKQQGMGGVLSPVGNHFPMQISNVQTEGKNPMLVGFNNNDLKFSALEDHLPQNNAFRIKEEETIEIEMQRDSIEPIDVDSLKICVETLLICDMTKVVEENDWTSSIWSSFTNGVVLARLIEKLDMIDLTSVNYNPKTKAHSKNNIKRVLNYIRENKPDISANLLHCDDEIFEGNSQNISNLLCAIHKKYKNKLKSMEIQQKKTLESGKYRPKKDKTSTVNNFVNYTVLDNQERKRMILPPNYARN